jgi:hypothetical protein
MRQENKGVFNAPQHAEEIDMLMRGEYKQFSLIKIDLSNVGFPAQAGNRGLYELEGNAIAAWPQVLREDLSNEDFSAVSITQLGHTKASIYIKFNHWDNPWLPLGLYSSTAANGNIPCAYCLSFGRFWVYVQNPSVGNSIFLLVTRGVSIYSPSFGPVVIGGYQAPTWQKLKG